MFWFSNRYPLALCFILLVAVGAGSAGIVDDRPSDLTMDVAGPDNVESGDTVDIVVSVNATIPLYGAEFILEYNSNVLTVEGVSSGPYLSQDANTLVAVAEADSNTETIEYAETRTQVESGVEGEGVLAHIEVTVKESAEDTVELSFSEAGAVNPDVESLSVQTSDYVVSLPSSDEPPEDDTNNDDPTDDQTPADPSDGDTEDQTTGDSGDDSSDDTDGNDGGAVDSSDPVATDDETPTAETESNDDQSDDSEETIPEERVTDDANGDGETNDATSTAEEESTDISETTEEDPDTATDSDTPGFGSLITVLALLCFSMCLACRQ